MVGLRRARRVRVHLVDGQPGIELPSVEGLLVSRRRREYAIAVPVLYTSAEARPAELDSKLLVIPRERVAFFEVIR